jgi:hypothetical protein
MKDPDVLIPKQAWQSRVLIQCRYGLSGVIHFIFLIILNIWIYYTITFCRFTFCFYIFMAKQTNRRKRSVFNETHLQKIFFENWRTTKLCEKKRTMPWIRKKIKLLAVIRWTSVLESVGALVNIQSSCYLILGLSCLETTDSDISSGRV